MLAQNSQSGPTSVRIAIDVGVSSRRCLAMACASMICLSNAVTTVHAGFVPYSAGTHPKTPSQTWTESGPDNSISIVMRQLTSLSPAGAWDEEAAIGSHTGPDRPNAPSGPFSVASGGTAGLAAGASGRNFTSPPESTGGNSAAGTFGSPLRLPITLLRYQMQQREFLFVPDPPPFELFRLS